jgi:predicted TIM-barrel fold metal-dependent hydrolase
VFEFCRERDWPMSVHQDLSSPGRPREREYMVEITEALDRHPDTTVVWCHVGADRRLDPHGYTDVVTEMTSRYDQLHFDLSWVLLERAVCPGGKPDPDWVEVLERHPERFVLGTDTIGDLDGFESRIRRFDPLLEALQPATRDLIARGNAERLWFAG